MTDTNIVHQIAPYFGRFLTDFSRAIESPHSTVAKWETTGEIPRWRDMQILAAARKLKDADAYAAIKAALENRKNI